MTDTAKSEFEYSEDLAEAAALDRASLGERLRHIRKQNGWTLAEVARRSGIAISTVSKIERGLMSPSYQRFMQLADGLGVDVSELFTAQGEVFAPGSFTLTRAGEAEPHTTGGYFYEMLGSDLRNKQMIPMFSSLRSHESRELPEFNKHAGEEFLIVLEGSLDVRFENRETVHLGVYDSIYFDSAMGHRYISTGEKDATFVVVCCPPRQTRNSRQAGSSGA